MYQNRRVLDGKCYNFSILLEQKWPQWKGKYLKNWYFIFCYNFFLQRYRHGEKNPWKKGTRKNGPSEKKIPGKILSDPSEKLGSILKKFRIGYKLSSPRQQPKDKKAPSFLPSRFFLCKGVQDVQPPEWLTLVSLKSISSLSNQRIAIKLNQRFSGDFLSREFFSRGPFFEDFFPGYFFSAIPPCDFHELKIP